MKSAEVSHFSLGAGVEAWGVWDRHWLVGGSRGQRVTLDVHVGNSAHTGTMVFSNHTQTNALTLSGFHWYHWSGTGCSPPSLGVT